MYCTSTLSSNFRGDNSPRRITRGTVTLPAPPFLAPPSLFYLEHIALVATWM